MDRGFYPIFHSIDEIDWNIIFFNSFVMGECVSLNFFIHQNIILEFFFGLTIGLQLHTYNI